MPDIVDDDYNESSGNDDDNDSDEEILDDENGSDDEDANASDSESEKDEVGDSSDSVQKELPKKRQKKKIPAQPKKKIGPQKQKKEIHTHLKKAKKFEIRKITRRITMLRSLKGTDEQKAKNNRKVEKLLLEMQAMKEFMIDQMTERIVDIFKGKSEQIYLDIWNAAQEHKEFEKLLQTLSNGSDDNKYKHIAFLRMMASKGILGNLKLIQSGTNIKKPKSKKALQKQLRKYNQKTKKLRKQSSGKTEAPNTTTEENEERKTENQALKSDKSRSKGNKVKKGQKGDSFFIPAEGNNSVDADDKPKAKKVKKNVDSFFLPSETNEYVDDDDNVSSDEDFAAPAPDTQKVIPKKKNRMGQRARKQLMERQNAKNMNSRPKNKQFNKSRNSSSIQHKQTKKVKSVETIKKVDENLHPSWQAKQKLKAQQGITAFSGTKITFDD